MYSNMIFLLVSFISGVLTVLAPCILPVLPIIIGGSLQDGRKRNPYIITGSLALSIILFTLILKFSTAFIDIPQQTWSIISGGIILFFGITALFPNAWAKVTTVLGLQSKSDHLLESSAQKQGRGSDILLGAALGPVFSSCSPTYFIILATVLPANFGLGLLYLAVYAAGLSLVLLLIAKLGQRFVKNIRWAADPNGWFKKGLAILFLLVGIFILAGADKKLQASILESGYFNITNVEQKILEQLEPKMPTSKEYPMYEEIQNPSGFVNTEPLELKDLIGEKVVLLDFMTYSCINCIRTFPYLNGWYEKYKDEGLEIVGIHTPEFAFEKDIDNVQEALDGYDIEFPVVLDNDYATWRAYGNRYWPRKYLINLEGEIVYDHIGEGAYEETENEIRALLGLDEIEMSEKNTERTRTQISPETYLGSNRREITQNRYTLNGEWNIQPEYAEGQENASLNYTFTAKDVFIVASADQERRMEVKLNGAPLSQDIAGDDIEFENGKSWVSISDERLYTIVQDEEVKTDQVIEFIGTNGVQIYTFTFGR